MNCQKIKASAALILILIFFSFGVKAMEVLNIVDNNKIASDLAETYISNIYGKEAAERQKPYLVIENSEYWEIQGVMQKRQLGGTFSIRLAKDGRVISLSHSR